MPNLNNLYIIYVNIFQNQEENACARVAFLENCRPHVRSFIENSKSFIEKTFQQGCFPVNFVKFLGTHFL